MLVPRRSEPPTERIDGRSLPSGLISTIEYCGAVGYGSDMTDDELQRWAVYHSGMMLVSAVEVSDQQLRGADWLVEELTRAVAAAGLIG